MDDQSFETMEPKMTQQTGPAPEVWPSAPKQPPNNMAAASLVMGILAVVMFCCPYTAAIFGGLAVVFALLSRTEEHFTGQAKAGIALAVAALILAVLVWVFFWGAMFTSELYAEPLPAYPTGPDITNGADNILTALPRFLMGGDR